MVSAFLVCRYIVFSLLTAYNAIIASVAAWNLGYARGIAAIYQLDLFLIIVGIIGTLFIFPIICIDIARKGAYTSRVYFELSWVALFWILQLCGAAALTALTPAGLCRAGAVLPRYACTSAQILVAFTWISMITHLFYFLALLLMSIFHSKASPDIWRAGVRDFPWFSSATRLVRLDSASDIENRSVQSWPNRQTQGRPRAMTQVEDYHVVHPYQYQSPPPIQPMKNTYQPNAAPVSRVQYNPPPPQPIVNQSQPSLYPQFLNISSNTRVNQPLPPLPVSSYGPMLTTPPPQPATFGRHTRSMSTPMDAERPRPGGPRGARHRPPPLDLSKLSNL